MRHIVVSFNSMVVSGRVDENPQSSAASGSLLFVLLCQAPEDIEQLLLVEGDLSTKRGGQSLSGLQQF